MKKIFFLILIIISSICSAAIPPELPRIYIQTPYDPPVGGQLFSVSNSSDFQSALNSAKLGDIIELTAGVVFTGTFTLPNKTSGTGWIYIRSSAYSNLPAPCTRVSPLDADNMPKIVAKAGSGGTIRTVSNAHHYRFVGIEFKPVANNFLYNVVYIGDGEKSESLLPNNIVFDRCYIHGDAEAGSRRGVLMNGAYISVIDSYISDCKEDGADSQALAAYSATGPIKIVNNFLEGAGENVMFGGADPSIPNAVPSDIEIRCNHFFKPLEWMNQLWDIKNLFELKNAQRVLVEGNTLENNWPNAQNGFSVLFTPRNQNNTAPWSVVQDITFRFNKLINIAQGLNISGYDAPNQSQRTSRVLIQNNTWNVTNLGKGGDGRLFQILGGPTDIVFDHNTGFCKNAYIVVESNPKIDFFEFRNNMVSFGTYGFIGTGTANAMTTLSKYFNSNWTIEKNAIIGGSSKNFPTGNYFPANNSDVGFTDFSNGDYRLTASSTYKNLGTDGKDIGADLDSIEIAGIYKGDNLTNIENSKNVGTLIIYPNPAQDKVILKYLDNKFNETKIKIFNELGISVYENSHENLSNDGIEIDIGNFPAGLYLCSVQSGKILSYVKFIVIK